MPHLDDGIVSEILYRLPTKDAYRVSAVCPQWHAVLYQPTFLSRHLSPRSLPLLDDRPYALVIQPRRKVGYFTHLTLVAVDPADRVPVNVPLQSKYRTKDSAPEPCLLDTASDDSVFNLLYSTGTDDSAPINAADDAEPLASAPDGAVSSDPAATTTDVSAVEEAPAPPLGERVEEYAVFFESTVPMLGISIVASHGRLLLCQSRSRYFVCDPAANRWLVLPPSTIAPVSVTNCGFHYDTSTGLLAFTVVLLVRRRRQRVLVDTFRSTTGRWDARELAASGAARCLGAACPGVHVGTCFYWLSHRQGRILGYDVARGRAFVFREPAEPDRSKGRFGRSLGSVGGRLRMCSIDIRAMVNGRMDGVLTVCVMDDGGPTVTTARRLWRSVHGEALWKTWMSHFKHELEKPVDFNGACGEFIVLDQDRRLVRYDLESGGKVYLARLQSGSGRLRALYRRFHAFPFFK